MSKNNLREITLVGGPIWGRDSLSHLDNLLQQSSAMVALSLNNVT